MYKTTKPIFFLRKNTESENEVSLPQPLGCSETKYHHTGPRGGSELSCGFSQGKQKQLNPHPPNSADCAQALHSSLSLCATALCVPPQINPCLSHNALTPPGIGKERSWFCRKCLISKSCSYSGFLPLLQLKSPWVTQTCSRTRFQTHQTLPRQQVHFISLGNGTGFRDSCAQVPAPAFQRDLNSPTKLLARCQSASTHKAI